MSKRFEGSTIPDPAAMGCGPADLDECLRRRFARGVLVGSEAPRDCAGELFPVERAVVLAAAPKRRHQFATSRLIARRLLGQMGFPARPLLPGDDRVPLWPEGIIGSITHTDDLCVVAVAGNGGLRSIGLDVERRSPLKPDLWEIVCTQPELDWLAHREEEVRGTLARLIFSAKECLYKCQYPVTRLVLGFQEIEIRIDQAHGRFEGRLLGRGSRDADVIASVRGLFLFHRDWIISGSLLPSR